MSLINGPEADSRVLDMSQLGPVLDGDANALNGGPPVTAMLVQGANPATVAPDSGSIRRGLMRDEMFLAVHEQFFTDTAMLADIVLPATTFLEHDDIYTSYGHKFFQIGPRAIDPLPETRSNHDVICALAKRLGAKHPAFDMTAWELMDQTIKKSGYTGADDLKARRLIDTGTDFTSSHFLNGFPNADGKFHFRVDWTTFGNSGPVLPELPDFADVIDKTNKAHPFRLITGPARNFLNSNFTETATSKKREIRPTVKLNPDNCAALDVADGDRVRLGNRQGDLVIHAEVCTDVEPGIAVVESVWPNSAFEEGIGINLLTSAEPAAPDGGAVFHDTAIWIRAEQGTAA